MMSIRSGSFSCAVVLAGGVLAAASPGARADDCALALAAAIAQAKVPHADTHVTTPPPTSAQMIFLNDKAYMQINGAWRSMPYSAQEQTDTVTAAAKRAEQMTHSCQKLGSEPIKGEAATLLTTRTEGDGKVSEARVWVSDKSGLPLKSEIHLSNGTLVTDDFRYGNIEAPPGVK
jgi:outer membrane lipoprotein-sorting protein